VEIEDYMQFFNLNGLVGLPFSQGSIPWNFCPLNIRYFALKDGVSKNFILFNP
jgi:hypothetical protein